MQKQCPMHGLYDDDPIVVFGRSIYFGCPACADDKRKASETTPNSNPEIAMKAMGIPPTLTHASFDLAIQYSDEFRYNFKTVQRLVAGEVTSIIMTGDPGTGKTYLAVCALKCIGGKLVSMYDLSVRIRSTYTPYAIETESSIINELSSLPLLVIDEVGRTSS